MHFWLHHNVTVFCVDTKTKYKNLITVYTQWNPIIANENYFSWDLFKGESIYIFPTRAPYVSYESHSS